MDTIRRILVGLGGTPYTTAEIRYSVELASRYGAFLTAATVVDTNRLTAVGPIPIGGEAAAEELRKHRFQLTVEGIQRAIEQFREACNAAGISYDIRRESGDPFVLMCSLARYHDLMVFGLRSLFDYGVGIEPVDGLAKLVSNGVRPLLAVPEQYGDIRRAILAYSGSMESANTVRQFIQAGLWPDASLRIVHCAKDRSSAEELVGDMSTYCKAHRRACEIVLDAGVPKDRILACATEWGADLIVLGNSARAMLVRRILGEASLNIMRHAQCALFLSQ